MEDLVYKRTSNLLQRTMELEEERARTQTLLKGKLNINKKERKKRYY